MAKRWNAGLASIRLRAFSQRNFHPEEAVFSAMRPTSSYQTVWTVAAQRSIMIPVVRFSCQTLTIDNTEMQFGRP
jgi:hypothetical protein